MPDLPAEEAPGVAHDRDRETAFAVDEADDPLLEPLAFLLIARTGRVVTGMAAPYCEGGTASTAGYSLGFPAYSRLHFDASPRRGRLGALFQVSSTLVPL